MQQRSRDVQHQYVSSVRRYYVAASYWDCHVFFRVFTIPRHIGDRGMLLSTLPAPRLPRSSLAPALSPSPSRVSVWGRRGTVARPRAVALRSREPSQNGAFYNRLRCEHPKRDDDDAHKRTVSHHIRIRMTRIQLYEYAATYAAAVVSAVLQRKDTRTHTHPASMAHRRFNCCRY